MQVIPQMDFPLFPQRELFLSWIYCTSFNKTCWNCSLSNSVFAGVELKRYVEVHLITCLKKQHNAKAWTIKSDMFSVGGENA